MITELSEKYISVNYHGFTSYGGSQTRCEKKAEKRCGCGLISVCDMLLYMSGGSINLPFFAYSGKTEKIEFEKYNSLITALSKYFIITYLILLFLIIIL